MNTLSDVLRMLGDPRWAELPAEALALLEPLPPSPALVDALTEVAATEIAPRPQRPGDRLGRTRAHTRRPARRRPPGEGTGVSRLCPRTPRRRRCTRRHARGDQPRHPSRARPRSRHLAQQPGHPAVGVSGPGGSTRPTPHAASHMPPPADWPRWARSTNASTLAPLIDAGRLDEALTVAAALAEHLEDDQSTLAEVRCVQARIHTLRGQAIETSGYLDWIETISRDEGSADSIVDGLGAAAHRPHRARKPRPRRNTPHRNHRNTQHPQHPLLRRVPAGTRPHRAHTRRPDLAQALTTDYDPRTPYAHHALMTTTAMHLPKPAAGTKQPQTAMPTPPTAGTSSALVPEQAFAYSGQGRCLIHLDQPHQADSSAPPSPRTLHPTRRETSPRRHRHAPGTSQRAQRRSTTLRLAPPFDPLTAFPRHI